MLFSPVNNAIVWFMKKRLKRLDRMMAQPIETQEKQLQYLLKKAAKTTWGKQHDYPSIKNETQFARQVPLQDYVTMNPIIDRVRKGEQNLIWPTEIKWFAKSSGTSTGKSKFLPVTHEAIDDCHFAGGKDLLAFYVKNNPNTKLFAGYSLRLGGSTTFNSRNHETYYGDLSAVLIENFPFWVEIRSTPNQSVALMEEWESKIELIASRAIKQDVTSLWGVNSWFLVLMHKVLEMTGKRNILDVWPNLELFSHGGVSFEPYEKQFRKIMPSEQVNYVENYNASEGFFALQDESPEKGMLLLLDHGIYYEFIPPSEFDERNSKTIPLAEVKMGINYAVVISTNAGLWRYILGDTVKFVSTDPYRIKISGRTKNFINAFGEEVIIDNAEKAIRAACEAANAEVQEYMAAPVYMRDAESGAHEWVIEFNKQPDDLDQFVRALDETLQKINSDYEAKRHKNMALRPPIVHVGRTGLFHDWLKKNGKMGGQHKIPRLMNDRSKIEELIALNST
jgi:phenylacetate-coenzyme A ligase PaaK-like adenylate-forming protein